MKWCEKCKDYVVCALTDKKPKCFIDRKTENYSEKPNNCETCRFELYCPEMCEGCCEWDSHYEPKDELQTELVRAKYHCINCAENGSYKCSKCDGEMYYKYDKDEP